MSSIPLFWTTALELVWVRCTSNSLPRKGKYSRVHNPDFPLIAHIYAVLTLYLEHHPKGGCGALAAYAESLWELEVVTASRPRDIAAAAQPITPPNFSICLQQLIASCSALSHSPFGCLSMSSLFLLCARARKTKPEKERGGGCLGHLINKGCGQETF